MKDGQLLLLNNPYQIWDDITLAWPRERQKTARLLRHRIQLGSPVAVYTLFLKLH